MILVDWISKLNTKLLCVDINLPSVTNLFVIVCKIRSACHHFFSLLSWKDGVTFYFHTDHFSLLLHHFAVQRSFRGVLAWTPWIIQKSLWGSQKATKSHLKGVVWESLVTSVTQFLFHHDLSVLNCTCIQLSSMWLCSGSQWDVFYVQRPERVQTHLKRCLCVWMCVCSRQTCSCSALLGKYITIQV